MTPTPRITQPPAARLNPLRPVTLVMRSLWHFRGTNLGLLLGVATATAVLTGAMVLGDCVRESLRRIAALRLGRAEFAVVGGDRFFRAALARDLAGADDPKGASAALQCEGTAAADGGQVRANRVQILGVDAAFWGMAPGAPPPSLPGPGEALVNEPLAGQLGVHPGDAIVLRVPVARRLPGEAAFATDAATTAVRVIVKALVSETEFGRFSLRVSQTTPATIFLSLPWLADKLGIPGRANLVLLAAQPAALAGAEALRQHVGTVWRAADAELEFRPLPSGHGIELRTDRVFLDPAVLAAAPAVGGAQQPMLTYFVNELRVGTQAAPYAFVAGADAPPPLADLADDEIVVNGWLAQDLGAAAGSSLTIRYYALGPLNRLEEKSATLRVRAVVPMAEWPADRDWVPNYPGLADAANCRDWKPGVPVELNRIRPQDEEYWKQYRGTPKALVSLRTAQRLWQNAYGNTTAVRFTGTDLAPDALAAKVMHGLNPASLGMQVLALRTAAAAGTANSVDFGQLFLGLSGFLVLAAAILTALLFAFQTESRATESGILLALGFTRAGVRRLRLNEAGLVALAGSALGAVAGLAYSRVLLSAMQSIWRGAVGGTTLVFVARPMTVMIGFSAGILVSLTAVLVVLRRQRLHSIRDLQDSGAWLPVAGQRRHRRRFTGVAAVCILGATMILGAATPGSGPEAAGTFFAAGALLLVAALTGLMLVLLRRNAATGAPSVPGIFRLALAGVARRPWRSLATMGSLACGLFLVTAVAANRMTTVTRPWQRDSGTGGFAIFAETSVPITHDLNTRAGRKALGLERFDFRGVYVAQVRVRDGDDASCMNLNRAQTPRLLGVPAAEFARRGAFHFSALARDVERAQPWLTLEDRRLGNDVVPGVADMTVIQWGMGKRLGDLVPYTDERGATFHVKLVGGLQNSVFQGSILVADDVLRERFPSTAGVRVLLAEVTPVRQPLLALALRRALADYGITVSASDRRLAEFSRVEHTYLAIFLALGGLGLVLGTVGLGLVVLRNVLERREELALLRAVGFSQKLVVRLLLTEHGLLLVAGVLGGVIPALIAVLPGMVSPGGHVQWRQAGVLLVGILVSGMLWIRLAVAAATRMDVAAALRGE